MQLHGAELRAVRQVVGTRTMPEVVRYYGQWKALVFSNLTLVYSPYSECRSKLSEENVQIRQTGRPPKSPSKQYQNAAEASDGQHVGLSDDEGSVVTQATQATCGACRTRESAVWWKAPKGLTTDYLCDNCGVNWRKYADLNVRPTREESMVPLTIGKKGSEKREGTPLTGPLGKRAKVKLQ
jgi:DNA-directed RNA polymerase subunit M/transcription elongation factor TFIIS